MSRKTIPTSIVVVICIVGVIGGLFLSLVVGSERRIYYQRCQDCALRELIPVLEVKYGIKFPASFIELKTAKSPVRDSMIHFCVKLTLHNSDAQSFFSSFKDEIDRSDPTIDWFFTSLKKDYAPAWMRRPKGLSTGGFLYSFDGRLMWGVEDTRLEDTTTIYLRGAY